MARRSPFWNYCCLYMLRWGQLAGTPFFTPLVPAILRKALALLVFRPGTMAAVHPIFGKIGGTRLWAAAVRLPSSRSPIFPVPIWEWRDAIRPTGDKILQEGGYCTDSSASRGVKR